MRLNHSNQNKACEYLTKHKRWIRDFQSHIAAKKNDVIDDELLDEFKKLKIKDIAQRMRDDIRSDNFNENPKYLNSLYRSKLVRDPEKLTVNDDFDANDLEGIAMDDESPDCNILEDRKPQVPRLMDDGKNLEGLKPDQEGKLTYVRPLDTKESPKKEAPKPAHKKKKMPAFAMTENQAEELELEEMDDLLDFFDNTNYSEYIDDLEVRNMVGSIKKRVDELKQEPNWQAKWNERLVKIKAKKREQKVRDNIAAAQQDDDMQVHYDDGDKTFASGGGGGNMFGGSVASDRTKESVDEIKEKLRVKNEKGGNWDAAKQNKAQSVALEERLAKHIADELLRNNMAMRNVHSNQSVRKIMERELQKELRMEED